MGEYDSENASVRVPAAIKADTSIDANFAGDKDTWRYISGFIIVNGAPVSWQSKYQKLCAHLIAEAEVTVESVNEALHLQLLCELLEYQNRQVRFPLEHGRQGARQVNELRESTEDQ